MLEVLVHVYNPQVPTSCCFPSPARQLYSGKIQSPKYFNTCSSSQSGDSNAGDKTLALDLFERSMTIADCYPKNIVYLRDYGYQLGEYARQLYEDRPKLFGDQNIVDFLEFREDTEGTGKLNNSLTELWNAHFTFSRRSP
jgi:hypothetical protein